MTFKQFLFRTLATTFIGLMAIMGWVALDNEFALFGDATGLKRMPVSREWERWAKYLYTFNYIPSNFQGIILGPSLADNIDPSRIGGWPIYNASINGGNITELGLILKNAIEQEGRLEFVVICIDPYITKDSGKKTNYLGKQDFWSALGSVELYRYYFDKFRLEARGGRSYYNEYGYYNFNIYKDQQDTEQAIEAALNQGRRWGTDQFKTDPQAIRDLKAAVDLAHANDIRVFAYYYPRPHIIFNEKREFYKEYHRQVDPIFDAEDVVWDFNDPRYEVFTRDYSNYCDHCHLSAQGAIYMTDEIARKIRSGMTNQAPAVVSE